MFIYDLNGDPSWVSAALTKTGPRTFAGSLDATTGPPFDSVPFDSARVAHAIVGSATLTFSDGADATFAYTLNGVSRSKALTRFVFRGPARSVNRAPAVLVLKHCSCRNFLRFERASLCRFRKLLKMGSNSMWNAFCLWSTNSAHQGMQ